MTIPPVRADVVTALYDNVVAAHYDDDAFGILTRARGAALTQVAHRAGLVSDACDFGAGTGDCLVAMRTMHPRAQLWGIDTSAGCSRTRGESCRRAEALTA